MRRSAVLGTFQRGSAILEIRCEEKVLAPVDRTLLVQLRKAMPRCHQDVATKAVDHGGGARSVLAIRACQEKPPDTHRVWSCAPPRVTVGLQRILPRRLDGSVSLVGHSSQSFVRPVGEDLFLGGLHPVFNQIASRRSGRECGACGDCYTRCHAKRMSVLVHDRPSARSANRDSVAPAAVP